MKNGIPLYEYLLAKENGRLGTWHNGEEIYCFGNISANSKQFDDSNRDLMGTMKANWTNFIRTSNPI